MRESREFDRGPPRVAVVRIDGAAPVSCLDNYKTLTADFHPRLLRVPPGGPTYGFRGVRRMSEDDSFEDMRKTINRMLKDAFEGKLGVFREPFVYGFTMRSREARGEGSFQTVEGQEISSRDPLVDVILEPESIHVTAELPGVHDEDVRARIDGVRLIIEADGDKRYYSAVDLPDDVDPLSLDCTFRNGVLDATLKRRKLVPRI